LDGRGGGLGGGGGGGGGEARGGRGGFWYHGSSADVSGKQRQLSTEFLFKKSAVGGSISLAGILPPSPLLNAAPVVGGLAVSPRPLQTSLQPSVSLLPPAAKDGQRAAQVSPDHGSPKTVGQKRKAGGSVPLPGCQIDTTSG
jgi:hypothetical protein